MMVMWSSHAGEDDIEGIGVTDYLCASAVWKPLGDGGRERVERVPPPEILRGDPQLMRWAISATPFQRKYSSAVLSFAHEDIDVAAFNAGDPDLRKLAADIMQAFEDAAFVGVPMEHRPPALWTTHTHTGRLELNVCMPRALLSGDGRLHSVNPHPPGQESRRLWDAFRDVLNCRYGWADPQDPARARLVSVPNWVQKIAAEAQRAGKETRKHVVQHVEAYVLEAVAQGVLRCRDDLLIQLQGQGIAIRRVGRDYVTLVNDAGVGVRLKGRVFSEDFTSPEALPANRPKTPRLNLQECEVRLRFLLKRRRAFNESRYGGPKWQRPGSLDSRDFSSSVRLILDVATPKPMGHRNEPIGDLGDAEIARAPTSPQHRGNFKARLFRMLFGGNLPDDLLLALRWVDRAKRALWLQDGACVVDHGEKITATKTSRLAVRLMIAEAQAKEWRCITLTGTDEFKRLASEEAAKAGIAVSNPEVRNFYSQIMMSMEAQRGKSNGDGTRVAANSSENGGRAGNPGRSDRSGDHGLDAASERLGRNVRKLAESFSGGVTRIRRKRELTEIETLKTEIDLRVVAAGLGFVADVRASDRNHTVMRHSSGAKLIVGVAASGHWVFSSNAGRQGSVIDLLQWQLDLSTGEAIKRLRDEKSSMSVGVAFGERPRPQPREGNPLQAKTEWVCSRRVGSSEFLEQERGIMEETLTCPRFRETFRIDDRQNVVFPYVSRSGLVGVERRNRPMKKGDASFKAYTRGGLPGLWLSHRQTEDRRLVFVESPIDAMAHYEMSPPELQDITRYVAIRNGCSLEDVAAVTRGMPKGAEIISACDKDRAGEVYTGQLRKIAMAQQMPFSVELPPSSSNDWNEALQASKTAWWRRFTLPKFRP